MEQLKPRLELKKHIGLHGKFDNRVIKAIYDYAPNRKVISLIGTYTALCTLVANNKEKSKAKPNKDGVIAIKKIPTAGLFKSLRTMTRQANDTITYALNWLRQYDFIDTPTQEDKKSLGSWLTLFAFNADYHIPLLETGKRPRKKRKPLVDIPPSQWKKEESDPLVRDIESLFGYIVLERNKPYFTEHALESFKKTAIEIRKKRDEHWGNLHVGGFDETEIAAWVIWTLHKSFKKDPVKPGNLWTPWAWENILKPKVEKEFVNRWPADFRKTFEMWKSGIPVIEEQDKRIQFANEEPEVMNKGFPEAHLEEEEPEEPQRRLDGNRFVSSLDKVLDEEQERTKQVREEEREALDRRMAGRKVRKEQL